MPRGAVRGLAAATALLLVGSVAALAIEVRDESAADRLASAARATAARGSARTTITFNAAFGSDEPAVHSGPGAVDFRAGRASADTGRFRYVWDGPVQYLWSADGGDRWGRARLGPGTRTHDVRAVLEELARGDAITVRTDGTEVVAGVRTTRYLVTFPEPTDPDEPFVDPRGVVWVSDDRLVRRLETSVGLRDDRTFRGSTRTDLYDFGAPVRIDLPPESEVEDVGEAP